MKLDFRTYPIPFPIDASRAENRLARLKAKLDAGDGRTRLAAEAAAGHVCFPDSG
jgi:hypothetical protein